MTDTPRTDENAGRYVWINGKPKFVAVEFARQLEREVMEQARLNGMGAEREARLMAQVTELKRENAALRAALIPWLAWEDTNGDIPPNAVRQLLRIARQTIDAAKEKAK